MRLSFIFSCLIGLGFCVSGSLAFSGDYSQEISTHPEELRALETNQLPVSRILDILWEAEKLGATEELPLGELSGGEVAIFVPFARNPESNLLYEQHRQYYNEDPLRMLRKYQAIYRDHFKSRHLDDISYRHAWQQIPKPLRRGALMAQMVSLLRAEISITINLSTMSSEELKKKGVTDLDVRDVRQLWTRVISEFTRENQRTIQAERDAKRFIERLEAGLQKNSDDVPPPPPVSPVSQIEQENPQVADVLDYVWDIDPTLKPKDLLSPRVREKAPLLTDEQYQSLVEFLRTQEGPALYRQYLDHYSTNPGDMVAKWRELYQNLKERGFDLGSVGATTDGRAMAVFVVRRVQEVMGEEASSVTPYKMRAKIRPKVTKAEPLITKDDLDGLLQHISELGSNWLEITSHVSKFDERRCNVMKR